MNNNENLNITKDVAVSEETANTLPADVVVENEEQPSEETTGTASAETPETPTADDVAENEEQPNAETTDTASDSVPAGRKYRPVLYVLFGILLAAAIIVGAYFLIISREIVWEAGETYSEASVFPNSFTAQFFTTDNFAVDTEKPGTYPVQFTLFDCIPFPLTIRVVDTTPPEIRTTALHTIVDTELCGEDFILFCAEENIAFSLTDDYPGTASPGTYTVTVEASDLYGNTAVQSAVLTVWDTSYSLQMELFDTQVSESFQALYPACTYINTDDVNTDIVGIYRLEAESPEIRYIWKVVVADTLPPEAMPKTLCIRPNESPLAADFLETVTDSSEYEVRFVKEPDFSISGIHTVDLIVEDIHKNSTVLQTTVLICDFPQRLNVELGTTPEEIQALLFNEERLYSEEFQFDGSITSFEIGKHSLLLESKYGTISIIIHVKDTLTPILETKNITRFIGDKVKPQEFVLSCTDNSRVFYRFIQTPSTDAVGSQSVSIYVIDEYGNSTIGTAMLTVMKDESPPIIYGTKDLQALLGNSISYQKGVYAIDNRDGSVDVHVDTSAVNPTVPGVYPVYYNSIDVAGNMAKKTVYLTISDIDLNLVNKLADTLLSSIVEDSMGQREKARAIYDWCINNIRYSTRTSNLMDHFVQGAYSGLTLYSGNCYVYYAVASVMLTQAGIENIEIRRDNPDNPHYWNLVKIDGNWYHFDTCPHYPGHRMECFLLTDAEVQHYSETEVEDYYSFDSSLYPATPK